MNYEREYIHFESHCSHFARMWKVDVPVVAVYSGVVCYSLQEDEHQIRFAGKKKKKGKENKKKWIKQGGRDFFY